jgi:hypothetical protein
MSQRNLNLSFTKHRADAYRDLAQNEVNEALWEALQILKTNGLDIGLKADAVLANRDQIKLNIPKE